MKREERNIKREDDKRVMKVVESFLTKNPCYKTNRKISVQGVALYSVGCPQPSAKVFVNNWNNEKYSRACAHAFVDANDGLVYQTLPWNHRGWHGDANRNNTMLGIMLCEPRQIKYRTSDMFDVVGDRDDAILAAERVHNSAVELCGQLCVKYKLDPTTAIWAPEKGASSPEHLWKGLGLEHTMGKFCFDVVQEMRRIRGDDTSESATVSELYRVEVTPEVDVIAKPSSIMQVRIDYDNLRIRVGPGTEYVTTGSYTGKGVFNLVEIQNGTGSKSGWGKLENGAGWISLDFVERL